jgi:hypothetical protein
MFMSVGVYIQFLDFLAKQSSKVELEITETTQYDYENDQLRVFVSPPVGSTGSTSRHVRTHSTVSARGGLRDVPPLTVTGMQHTELSAMVQFATQIEEIRRYTFRPEVRTCVRYVVNRDRPH